MKLTPRNNTQLLASAGDWAFFEWPAQVLTATWFLIPGIVALLCTPPAQAQIPISGDLSLYGDIRTGYFGVFRDERDGTRIVSNEWRTRARIGLEYRFSEQVSLRVRHAARLSSDKSEMRIGHSTSATGNNGLRIGESAFDEAALRVRLDRTTLQMGRFLTGFTLPGVINNAIIRNDAPNNDVQWTDGLWLTQRLGGGWQTDAIIQVQHGNWSSNTMRRPLNFSSDDANYVFFASISRRTSGRLRLIGTDFTIIPNALRYTQGSPQINPQNLAYKTYAAVSGKFLLGWDLPENRVIQLGAEGAMSLFSLQLREMGLAASGDEKAGRFGFQVSGSVHHVLPNHHLGVVAGVLQPMLLTSGDYWDNGWMYEIRHQWVTSRRLSFESRLRWRGDGIRRANATAKRSELVPYVRLTYRFR